MPIIRAMVVLPYLSNKPEDVTVNTFHFNVADYNITSRTSMATRLAQLYNDPVSTGASIASFLSNVVKRDANACQIKFYDLADAKPRPVLTSLFTLAASQLPSGVEIPAEAAVCGSFYALRNLPRQRGRVYFGPFHTGALLDSSVDRSRPGVALVEAIRAGLNRLMTPAVGEPKLAVYSRTDNQARDVTGGWVDDAWDTQRRRGQDAMTRVLFPSVV